MSRPSQSILSAGDTQQIIAILQALGRCAPVFGASISSLCCVLLTITSKIDEMRNARIAVRELAGEAFEASNSVCQILEKYAGKGEEAIMVAKKLENFVRTIKEIEQFISIYVKKNAGKRFVDSNADTKRVKEFRRKMYDSTHSFTIAVTSHTYMDVVDLRKEVQVVRDLQLRSQNRSEEMFQILQRSATPPPCNCRCSERKREEHEKPSLDLGFEAGPDFSSSVFSELSDEPTIGGEISPCSRPYASKPRVSSLRNPKPLKTCSSETSFASFTRSSSTLVSPTQDSSDIDSKEELYGELSRMIENLKNVREKLELNVGAPKEERKKTEPEKRRGKGLKIILARFKKVVGL
ncbi:hypothetical protein SCHPADRAFT_908440 [Schizopora paradoxa]|uniref:Uncharacterized protein n=1 Tax=Schizopora paradoxa TaxID=27342 RepID=A0A0H2RBB0_9AGAM|nr:hypothetical protein SCHPADRAFT_908440 [Schizopora paradoxa]